MTIRIITDSACDLPKDITRDLGINVLPLIVYLDEEEYLDGVTIEPENVLQAMREGKVPKTAQIPPQTFKDIFLDAAKKGETCIYLAFSSQLSGTYQTSLLIANEIKEDYPNFDLHIVDTKCASTGFGLVVHQAAKMAQEGNAKEDILEAIEFYTNHMEHIFTVDELDYLYRGGRVSRTAAFVGNLLNIKPILDVEDGKLIPLEKIRGRKKVLKRMIDLMEERGADLANQTIGISHGDDLEVAQKMKAMMEEQFGCKDFIINTLGCAVGAHAGPGTLSIFFLNKPFDR